MEAEFLDEQSDPVAAKERRVAAAKARQAKVWAESARLPGDDEYRMNFGQYSAGKGLTVMEVMQKDGARLQGCTRKGGTSWLLAAQVFSESVRSASSSAVKTSLVA